MVWHWPQVVMAIWLMIMTLAWASSPAKAAIRLGEIVMWGGIAALLWFGGFWTGMQ